MASERAGERPDSRTSRRIVYTTSLRRQHTTTTTTKSLIKTSPRRRSRDYYSNENGAAHLEPQQQLQEPIGVQLGAHGGVARAFAHPNDANLGGVNLVGGTMRMSGGELDNPNRVETDDNERGHSNFVVVRRRPSADGNANQSCQHYHNDMRGMNRAKLNDNDNNNNNNNNDNRYLNGKPASPIAPVRRASSCGSKRLLDHDNDSSRHCARPSGPIKLGANGKAVTHQDHQYPHPHPHQHNQQQKPTSQMERLANMSNPYEQWPAANEPRNCWPNSKTNYHHYDYFTDSDLTLASAASPRQLYNENILLFATEHAAGANGHQQAPRQPTGLPVHKQQQQQQQVASPQRASVSLANTTTTSQPAGACEQLPSDADAGRPSRARQKVGKFVNYYPSSRQPSASRQTSPYSFHVPLHLQQPASRSASPSVYYLSAHSGAEPATTGNRRHRAHQQARYGYVTSANGTNRLRLTPAPGQFSQSLRSRTIGHIPSLVHTNKTSDSSSPYEREARNQTGNGNGQTHQEGVPLATGKHLIASESDLLRSHVVYLRPGDTGHDNPFRPGTELSWEADMMVRLIKRGYPLQELPSLVQAAKEVARETGHSQSFERLATKTNSNSNNGSSNGISHSSYSNGLRKQTNNKSLSERNQQQRQRRLSAGGAELVASARSRQHMASCKQVWADSLSRTKSMPRFYSATNDASADRDDTDSLDKLISDIEREMRDLMGRTDGDTTPTKLLASAESGRKQTEKVLSQPRRQGSKRIPSSFSDHQLAAGRRSQANTVGSVSHQQTGVPSDEDETTGKLEDLMVANKNNNNNTKKMQMQMQKKKKAPKCCLVQ